MGGRQTAGLAASTVLSVRERLGASTGDGGGNHGERGGHVDGAYGMDGHVGEAGKC